LLLISSSLYRYIHLLIFFFSFSYILSWWTLEAIDNPIKNDSSNLSEPSIKLLSGLDISPFFFISIYFAFARLPNRILHGMCWLYRRRPPPQPPQSNPSCFSDIAARFVCCCRCPRRAETPKTELEKEKKKRLSC
jgi:hypothetical protein